MKPLVIFLLLFSPFLSAETLHDILARNRIPIVGFTKREMDDEISSSSRHIVGDNLYLIMQVDRNGAPSPYMYVVRYGPVKPMLTETRLKAVSAECFGSVLDVKEMARSVLIVTHINPSASCTIALDANTLRPQKTFMGW